MLLGLILLEFHKDLCHYVARELIVWFLSKLLTPYKSFGYVFD